jgi:hypothetical protein
MRGRMLLTMHACTASMAPSRHRSVSSQRDCPARVLQRQLRQKVERRQATINQMPERNYKKFQNDVRKYLSAAEREAHDKYCALWGNRLAGVRHVRGEIYTKVRSHMFCHLCTTRPRSCRPTPRDSCSCAAKVIHSRSLRAVQAPSKTALLLDA